MLQIKSKIIFLFLFSIISNIKIYAQIEGLIVENYYTSDKIDETDTLGGILPAGSKTYRIFIDLKEGSKIKRIFGEVNHPFIIKSKNVIWNNKIDGQSFAYNFNRARYGENTVALDSWLTLGQTSKSGSSTNFGVLKKDDTNGSFIGGINNDGGSAEIQTGLLTNRANEADIPLTISDGMNVLSAVPNGWSSYGIVDPLLSEDTTIFGLKGIGNEFISDNFSLQNSGVSGVIPSLNHVLIAQITTMGEELELELNVELIEQDNSITRSVNYVATDKNLGSNYVYNPLLKYPPRCGCKDPDFLESRKKYACENMDSCKTRIVFGCMDTIACNFNSQANFNIASVCCYIGLCNDLDISLVCPDLKVRKRMELLGVNIYPSLPNEQLFIEVNSIYHENLSYQLIDCNGKIHKKGEFGEQKLIDIGVGELPVGIYLVRILTEDFFVTKKFIKS